MRWGTNEMGDHWDWPMMGWLMKRGTNEMGDQWDGGPMSSNNVLGDQWVGGPMRRGPMRWVTNERGDQWADPVNFIAHTLYRGLKLPNAMETNLFDQSLGRIFCVGSIQFSWMKMYTYFLSYQHFAKGALQLILCCEMYHSNDYMARI